MTRTPLAVWPLPKSHWYDVIAPHLGVHVDALLGSAGFADARAAIDVEASKITSWSSPGAVGEKVNFGTGEARLRQDDALRHEPDVDLPRRSRCGSRSRPGVASSVTTRLPESLFWLGALFGAV